MAQCAAALLLGASFITAAAALPTDAEIREILRKRVDVEKRGVGIVVGVVEPQGQRVIAYGALKQGDSRPLNGDTLFEIGSITKVFTSLLLADMVQKGEVKLDDPVAKYLPAEVKMPQRGGKSITLVDLATHTSGLPRLPANMAPRNPADPYADYTTAQMYEFLSGYQLTRDIGAQYEYSNLAVGLLGHALARRAGTDYESLVRSKVTQPLGMTSTAITLTPELASRLATGHDASLSVVPNWNIPTFAGAGALRSSANDMLKFVAANLGLSESPLSAAMTTMTATRRSTPSAELDVALAWHVFKAHGKEIFSHNGGTGGYRTFIGLDRQSRQGVVVLSNVGSNEGVDDIGRHLLDPEVPLLAPPRKRQRIVLSKKIYENYVGRYQLTPNLVLTITRDGNHLVSQATGQPKVEIFPESQREFFLRVVDAQISFMTDASGKATELVLHQNGQNITSKRIGDAPPSTERTEIKVSPKVLDGYVGRYQLTPNLILTVTREADQLYAQATGQAKLEIYPASNKEFFYVVVDAKMTFQTDTSGRATQIAFRQNGRDLTAQRIE